MKDLGALYDYIIKNYNNFSNIKYTDPEIVVVFHDELKMKVVLKEYFDFYFNDIFYYHVDWQDVKDMIDDIFTNTYAFCEQNKKIKIVGLKNFQDKMTYRHVWTIKKTDK